MSSDLNNQTSPPSELMQSGSAVWLLGALLSRLRFLLIAPTLTALVAFGGTYLIPNTYTAVTVLLPAQPSQSSAAALLSSIGGIAGAVAGSAGRSSGDQFVALMQSVRLEQEIIDKFQLDKVYDTEYRFQTHRLLKEYVQISSDRRSGLIRIAVDDKDPKRSADIANAYVDSFKKLSSELTLTEAQKRRRFFEIQLEQTRIKLQSAQIALQESGFGRSTLRAEPRVAADAYSKMLAETTAAEVRLRMLQQSLAAEAPEVQQQQAIVLALRNQISTLESASRADSDPDYLSRYRDYKYQETLLELLSKQYEAARMDESRDAQIIQVIDVATVPEYKSRPKRAPIAAAVGAIALLLCVSWVLLRAWFALRAREPEFAANIKSLRRALK